MEKEEKLEKLFREINEKPKNLDHNIMLGIYRQVELEKNPEQASKKSWIWTTVLIGIVCVSAAIYAATIINFQADMLIWVIGLSALIPLIIDKILFSSQRLTLR